MTNISSVSENINKANPVHDLIDPQPSNHFSANESQNDETQAQARSSNGLEPFKFHFILFSGNLTNADHYNKMSSLKSPLASQSLWEQIEI